MKIFQIIACFILLPQSPLRAACDPGSFEEVAGSPFAAGTTPTSVAFSPVASSNLFAAVTDQFSDNVLVYLVNQTTGFFTPVAGSPFAAGDGPRSVTFSPIVSGNLFAAVANFLSNNVSVYTVNQTTGFFTPVAGSPFAAGTRPNSVAFSPLVSGNLFAAVTNNNSNNVSVYSVNTATGVFTPVAGSPFATGAQPRSVAFSPVVSGNLFAAVANNTDNTVSVYSVNTTTGSFTPIAGSPFTTGTGPFSVAFSPLISGNLFAAVANNGGSTVSVYSVNTTTGAFTPVAGSPFTTGNGPTSVAFSPAISGNLFAAVSNGSSNTVSVYSVNPSTGVFTEISGSPFATDALPFSVAFSPVVMNNLFTAVANFSASDVSVYSLCLPPIPPTPSANLQPPHSATACKTRNIFLTQTDLINSITWTAPTSGDTPLQYQIYRKSLSNLIGVVLANSKLQFLDHNRKKNKNYTYFIVSGDGAGNVSSAITVTATENCERHCAKQ